MIIELPYEIGQVVYLKTDEEQKERVIVGIEIRPGSELYIINCATETSYHYAMEFSKEKDMTAKFK